MNESYEVLERKGDEELPPPELKPLPQECRYEFLDETERFLVIINSNLTGNEKKIL